MSSFEALKERLHEQIPGLVGKLKNGECRFVQHITGSDDQGFPTKTFEPRTEDFFPCIWKTKSEADQRTGDQTIGNQARSIIRFAVTIPHIIGEDAVVVEPSDRIELKLEVGAEEFVTHDVVAVIPRSGVNLLIYTTDIGVQL